MAVLLFVFSISAVSAVIPDATVNDDSDYISVGIGNTPSGGTLLIKNGTYNKLPNAAGDKDYGITINDDITIIGEDKNGVTIEGNGGTRLFTITSAATVTFINITFKNGFAGEGGAIYNTDGTISIEDCVFDGNRAESTPTYGLGGAIYQNNGYMEITNSKFINNKAVYGGAIRINNGDLIIDNCNFQKNYASIAGGALYVQGGSVEIYETDFTDNSADRAGGAIYNKGTLYIEDSKFEGNSIEGIVPKDPTTTWNTWGGGAIYNDGDPGNVASLTITNSVFNDNSINPAGTPGGWGGGGAIYSKLGILIILDSNFTNNNAGVKNGGAIYSTGDTVIFGSNFLNNIGSKFVTTLILVDDYSSSIVLSGNILVNYNRIIDTNDKGLYYIGTGLTDIDLNWWGGNAPSTNIPYNNYYVAKLTHTPIGAKTVGDMITLIYELVLEGIDDPTSDSTLLPDFSAKLYYNGAFVKDISGKGSKDNIKLASESNFFEIPVDDVKVYLLLRAAKTVPITNPVVNKTNTTLTVSAPTINQGKKTDIKVTLKDTLGNLLVGEKVTITIGGKTYTGTTDSAGIATFIIANLKGGKFTINANYAGNTNYASSASSAIQTVKPKVDLVYAKIVKVKGKNKKVPTYKITIVNKGSLKSKATSLKIWHIRNGVKIKNKIVKVKALKAGQKVTLVVKYYSDIAYHKYCKEYFMINPKKTMKEISYKNNLKVIG